MKIASSPRVTSNVEPHPGQRREEAAEGLLAHAAMADAGSSGSSWSA